MFLDLLGKKVGRWGHSVWLDLNVLVTFSKDFEETSQPKWRVLHLSEVI
jgi:hypothetical protein